ncbi:uncharacterized protein LOC117170530 isoform X1 [Belonocnema kinseyi]|uniref:uncharacterized protein LOC117170530 isoform X1 n=1 Tax=Belonocnema kinseyi TaxID=2817044 RepID=UPI00143D8EB2|nr:uncharacterized protein LOC117170530 isoform X1 [Belonocnema kinseyi]
MDLLSKLEQRSESESHQESSPQTQSTGEGLPETELHLHINPQTLSTEQRISRTTSYLQAQPQVNLIEPKIPVTLVPSPVPLNEQGIPATLLHMHESEFYLDSHFQYYGLYYRPALDGRMRPTISTFITIIPGNYRVRINSINEAVGFWNNKRVYHFICFQRQKVALRKEGLDLRIRLLAQSEIDFLRRFEGIKRRVYVGFFG